MLLCATAALVRATIQGRHGGGPQGPPSAATSRNDQHLPLRSGDQGPFALVRIRKPPSSKPSRTKPSPACENHKPYLPARKGLLFTIEYFSCRLGTFRVSWP